MDYDVRSLRDIQSRAWIGQLEQLHEAIERSIRSIDEDTESITYDEDYPYDLDFGDEQEQIEGLLGVAFVAAQVYLTTVRTSMLRASELSQKKKGSPLSFITDPNNGGYSIFDCDNPVEPKSGRRYIIVVNAVANYWKHHDEWSERLDMAQGREFGETLLPRWDTSAVKSGERKTIEIVTAIGMWPNRSINMQVAALTLGIAELWDLSPLRKSLDDWARCLLKRAHKELDT
jgi:hypothetical protein